MKKIAFNNLDDLNLPSNVIESLEDSEELANIRVIGDDIYIIVTYPEKSNILQPICLKVDDEGMSLYHSSDINIEALKDGASFTDFISFVLNRYEDILYLINQDIEKFEDHIDMGVKKGDIQNYFTLNKTLIYYETAIGAISELVNFVNLEKIDRLYDREYVSDYANIKIEINQLNKNIDMYQKIISNIVDISDSLFTSKLNRTMKKLTTITLVLSIPTFITSFYGMNIYLPFQDHPYSLLFVISISLVLTGISVIYLYYNEYF